MTPAARAAVSVAQMKAQMLTPRINNAMVRARSRTNNEPACLEHLEEAMQKAGELIQAIQIAQAALTRGRREAER